MPEWRPKHECSSEQYLRLRSRIIMGICPVGNTVLLGIEPTFACNFHCNYCMHALPPSELQRTRGWKSLPMQWETFLLILEQMRDFPNRFKKVTFAGDGEPLINPQLPEMIQRVVESGRTEKTLVITNGSLLTPQMSNALLEAGLSELKISMQGLSAEKYREICGVDIDFEQLENNISYFYHHKRNTKLSLKIADTALAPGEETVYYDRFSGICDAISIEHIYPEFHSLDYAGKTKLFQGKNRFGFDYKSTHVCGEQFFKMNVLRSGEITFGCPDGVSFDGFNVHNITLSEAWNSKELRTFLYDHLTHRLERHPACINCTRWDYSVVPEDMLDGHEDAILARMNPKEWDFSSEMLREEIIQCGSN